MGFQSSLNSMISSLAQLGYMRQGANALQDSSSTLKEVQQAQKETQDHNAKVLKNAPSATLQQGYDKGFSSAEYLYVNDLVLKFPQRASEVKRKIAMMNKENRKDFRLKLVRKQEETK